MSDAISVSAPISGTDRTMSFEAGKLAQLADGAVLGRIGDTVLLATATAARSVREGTDFFPLTVDIEERAYAAGKIPGSFFRREGKSSDQAILTCRLIDRPLRPSFPDGFRNEIHIVGTIVGADQVNPHDVLAINASSAALMISGIPFDGPIGAVRVAYTTDGELDPAPDLRGGRGLHLRARRGGPGPDRGPRHRDRHHDGRGRRDREVVVLLRGRRAQGHRGGAGGGPRGVQAVDPRGDQPAAPAGRGLDRGPRAGRDHPLLDLRRLPARRLGPRRGDRDRAHRQGQPRHHEGAAQRCPRRGRRRDQGRAQRGVRGAARRGQGGHPVADQEAGAQAHRRGRRAGRRPRHVGHPPALGRDRPVPDGARLGALPARRDPGAQRHHPRHAADEPVARHDHSDRVQALHAPLQLPAVLDRGDRVHARPQAPRDRPRPPGRAGPPAGRARVGRVPLHAARRLRRARLERVDLHGLGLRVDPLAHGGRGADSRRPSPASPWAWSTTAAPT